jgi:hypothetical protein
MPHCCVSLQELDRAICFCRVQQDPPAPEGPGGAAEDGVRPARARPGASRPWCPFCLHAR